MRMATTAWPEDTSSPGDMPPVTALPMSVSVKVSKATTDASAAEEAAEEEALEEAWAA